MRSKLLSSATAISLIAGTVAATIGPAAAQSRHYAGQGQWYRGYGFGGVPAGVNRGPVPAATSPDWAPDYYDYIPGPVYGYGPLPFVAQGGNLPRSAAGYCAQRFHSYDPANGTYLGFDGRRHSCP